MPVQQFHSLVLITVVDHRPVVTGQNQKGVFGQLKTIERFEEDLTDKVTVHGSLKVIMEVGEAIEVSPERDRSAEVDPLMSRVEESLQGMLDRLARESPLYVE